MNISNKGKLKYVFKEVEFGTVEYYKLEYFRGYISRALLNYIELALRENMKIDDIIMNEDGEYESINRFLELSSIRRAGYDPNIFNIKLRNNTYLTADDIYYAKMFLLPFYDIKDWIRNAQIKGLKDLSLLVDDVRRTGFDVQLLFNKRKDGKFFSEDEIDTILRRHKQGLDVSFFLQPINGNLYWDEIQMSVISNGLEVGMTYEDLVFINGEEKYLSSVEMYHRIEAFKKKKESERNKFLEKNLNIMFYVESELLKTYTKEDINPEVLKDYSKKITLLKSEDFSVLKELTDNGCPLPVILDRLTPKEYNNSVLLSICKNIQSKGVDISYLLSIRKDGRFWSKHELKALSTSKANKSQIDFVTKAREDGTYWNMEEIKILLEAFRIKFNVDLISQIKEDGTFWKADEMTAILECFKEGLDYTRLLEPDANDNYMEKVDMVAFMCFMGSC